MATSIIPKQHPEVIPISNGGTGATNASDAVKNLDIIKSYGNKSGDVVLTFSGLAVGIIYLLSSTASRNGIYLFRGLTSQTSIYREILGSGVATLTGVAGKLTISLSALVGFRIQWLDGESNTTIS